MGTNDGALPVTMIVETPIGGPEVSPIVQFLIAFLDALFGLN